jgi:hypothetical protein
MDSLVDDFKTIVTNDNFTILVINPIHVNDNFVVNENIIKNIIEKINDANIKRVTTDSKNFTSDIVEGLELESNKTSINTTILHEEEQYIWQMCYIDEYKKNDKERKLYNELNHIASFLTQDKKTIYGKTVLFCSKVNDLGSCDNASMSINNILQLLKKKLSHIGCTITQNGKVHEFEYTDTLKDLFDQPENWKFYETSIYGTSGFHLQLFYDHSDGSSTSEVFAQTGSSTSEVKHINKLASVLCNKKMFGNVKVICKSSEHNFVDIDSSLLLRLRNVLRGPLTYRNVEEKYNTDEKDDRKLKIVKNRWWILKSKEKELKINKCWVCDNDKLIYLCGGCSRLWYCSKACQKSDWTNHKLDCTLH